MKRNISTRSFSSPGPLSVVVWCAPPRCFLRKVGPGRSCQGVRHITCMRVHYGTCARVISFVRTTSYSGSFLFGRNTVCSAPFFLDRGSIKPRLFLRRAAEGLQCFNGHGVRLQTPVGAHFRSTFTFWLGLVYWCLLYLRLPLLLLQYVYRPAHACATYPWSVVVMRRRLFRSSSALILLYTR